MTERVFVDTNVLVYSRDTSEAKKQPLAAAWCRALWQTRAGALSAQVLAELYVTLTRKLSPGWPSHVAQSEIEEFALWRFVPTTAQLVREAIEAEARHRLHFWDALIVAAARAAGCKYLLSEDFSAGQGYGSLKVVDPFRTNPGDLLG